MADNQFDQVATPLCEIEQRLTRTEQVGLASEVFNTALLAGEVVVKWSTSTALSLLRVQDPARPDRLALQVVRSGVIGWMDFGPTTGTELASPRTRHGESNLGSGAHEQGPRECRIAGDDRSGRRVQRRHPRTG